MLGAYIRHYFHVDPKTLSEQEFIDASVDVFYLIKDLDRRQSEIMEDLIANISAVFFTRHNNE